MGCWQLSEDAHSRRNSDETERVLCSAWDAGIRYFDTAGVYGDGLGERMFRRLGWRHEAIISTKLSARQRPQQPVHSIASYYGPDDIASGLERSLRRLSREHVDLLQLHNWYPAWDGSGDEVLGALQDAKASGKARAVGVSFPSGVAQDGRYLLLSGMLDVIQVPLNELEQWPRRSLIPAAAEQDVAVIARAPFAHGVLTSARPRLRGDATDPGEGALNEASESQIGNQSGTSTAAGQSPVMALASSHRTPGVDSVLVGMRTIGHVLSNAPIMKQLAPTWNWR